jgi:hypothetical protein
MRKTVQLSAIAFIPTLSLFAFALMPPRISQRKAPVAIKTEKPSAGVHPKISAAGRACLACHESVTPGVVMDWKSSKHYGAGVDCATCHLAAGKGNRPDIQDHNGFKIVVLVTPKNCQTCHAREAIQFEASRHADAARFIGSLDNTLGEVVAGGPASNSGCKQCHGSVVTVSGKNGQLDPTTWPNTGIGRINPDGSKGACTACHSRHAFSIAQARTPEACNKCHLGPDHPQEEIWDESKHGTRYHMNLALGVSTGIKAPAGKWIPGHSYSSGPTCASCHMSATSDQHSTHDVGARLSWTLRPVISIKQDNWEKKREAMSDVCYSCHSPEYVKDFYTQFDAVVTLYNNKYAIPAKSIMDKLTAEKKLSNQPFDVPIKWTYYELWHHEGRRARQGAAMSGPDYTWWHGLYEVSKVFYTEFLPQARALDPKVVDDTIDKMPEHDWFTKGMTPEQLQQILNYYKTRYGQ